MRAATSGRRARAEALLRDASARPWARLVLGEGWDGDASAPGGPNGWAPLLYVCTPSSRRAALARELLARGADPNVTFSNEYGDMPALYGAAGVVHDPELTRVLLEAGANPDDGESLYHATEAERPGVPARADRARRDARSRSCLAHALDDERPEHVRLLLDAGADAQRAAPVRRPPRPRAGVPAAARRARRGPRAPRGRGLAQAERLRTAYQHARAAQPRRRPRAALAELGADTHVDADDLAVAAIARGERPETVPSELDYDQQEVLILAALRGQMAHVVELLRPGLPRRRRRLAGGAAAAPRGVGRQRGRSSTTLLAAGADPARGRMVAAGHRRDTRRATRTAITSASPSGSSPPATPIEPWMLEQADGPLAA